jgi:23S rRNA pseudouridine2605 synthase
MSDPEERESLGNYCKGRNDRLFHVGRLDKESEGLILLTNDGDFAHKATHPSFGLEKRYLVEVEGEFNKQIADQMLQGVKLEDGLARALEITPTRAVNKNHHGVEVVIHEGRYQILRRLIESFDLRVLRLIRTEFGPISLSDMKSGRHRILHGPELIKLLNVLHIKP